MKMEKNKIKVYDGKGRMILKAPLANNNTFNIEINTIDHQCLNLIINRDKDWIWHHKYGHLKFKSLGMLNMEKMVYRLPQVKEPS